MPELPEVETIKLGLKKKILGKKIKDIEIITPKLVNFDVEGFEKGTIGASISNIQRRAKLIIINLSNNNSIIIHLKLTGQLIYKGQKEKSTRAVFYFTDNTKLIFNDWRKFGYFKIIPTTKIKDFFKAQKFGPEPLSQDFSLYKFKQIINKKPKAKIKPFLMNQTNIAGIGNIYADESLFDAGILPTHLVKDLSETEIKKIHKSIIKILKEAIKYRGSSFDAYVDSSGDKGNFAKRVKVYRRTGQKCYKCGSIIKRITLGGRGTHFCPKCQK